MRKERLKRVTTPCISLVHCLIHSIANSKKKRKLQSSIKGKLCLCQQDAEASKVECII